MIRDNSSTRWEVANKSYKLMMFEKNENFTSYRYNYHTKLEQKYQKVTGNKYWSGGKAIMFQFDCQWMTNENLQSQMNVIG